MSFTLYVTVVVSALALGYWAGLKDGKVEGRIESFQEQR